MRLGNLVPRFRMGMGFIYDSFDVKRFQDKYLNARLVTVAEIATLTGLPRLTVSRKLRDYRESIAATKGNKNRRIGALYDLDSPVIKHLFNLWGWDKRIEERTKQNGDSDSSTVEGNTDGREPGLPDPEMVRRNVAATIRRRTRSESGR